MGRPRHRGTDVRRPARRRLRGDRPRRRGAADLRVRTQLIGRRRTSRGKGPPARGRLVGVHTPGELLVSRRHVDLARQASALCRAC
ncbi:putative leader peptide [Actinomycetospora chlora]|uniref:putative leader peptide n=1 Tax=Actinomycetospora chlora TaxID=663608 RepID=UPI003CD06F13